MKEKMPQVCPECGSYDIRDCWTNGRMLQYSCRDCNWKAAPRVPETIPIKTVKTVYTHEFPGWEFEIFDKYGHTIICSQTYDSEKAALAALEKDMARHNRPDDVGVPYTAVMFPDKVEVKGKKFEFKNGKCVLK